jgi:hypothetical protein
MTKKQNSIHVIHPYWDGPALVFDDESVGLRGEPFVAGADKALELLAATVPGCEESFSLTFSDDPFPGYQLHAEWQSKEYGGNWYLWKSEGICIEGWLCPALLKYFEAAPSSIYVQITPPRRTAQ